VNDAPAAADAAATGAVSVASAEQASSAAAPAPATRDDISHPGHDKGGDESSYPPVDLDTDFFASDPRSAHDGHH
jgi:hypothetical protein